MEAAGGVGKGITKEFNVDVNQSTLEIHLSWAGKGTNAIPMRGVYGPLISAITVTPSKFLFLSYCFDFINLLSNILFDLVCIHCQCKKDFTCVSNHI
jgi:hypothetical protein